MAIMYKKGDVLESGANIIAHGCNCVGGFGSGVAGAIAKKYPEVKQAYHNYIDDGFVKLGQVHILAISETQAIANCFTQYNYLPRNVRNADYDAIKEAMTNLKNWAKPLNETIAMPKIGAGLAGGDWNVIEGILKEVFNDYDVTVYVL